MTKNTRNENKGNPFLLILILVLIFILIFLIFLNLPGMLVLGYLKHSRQPHLSLEQLWIGSLLVSAATFIVLKIGFQNWQSTIVAYLLICLIYGGGTATAAYLLNLEVPKIYLEYFFDEKTLPLTNRSTTTLNSGLAKEKNKFQPNTGPLASTKAVTLTLPGGDSYVGEVKKGKPHGFGTLYRANGGRYEGIFEDGQRVPGNGKLYLPDGQVTEM